MSVILLSYTICGNTKTLYLQADDPESKTELSPKVKIPIYRADSGYAVQIPDQNCISRLFNKDTTDFDLILNYYRREVRGTSDHGYYTYTKMSPLKQNVTEQFKLTVDGEDSLGGIFIKPYINLLQNYEPITKQFLFPLNIF